ncbi:unnamed protein product, partial [Symbiodinium microadriaticum]
MIDKVNKRRELYGRIYSEIGEALDAQRGEEAGDDALLHEAQEVGRQGGLIGVWGSRPSKLPYAGPDITVEIVAGRGGDRVHATTTASLGPTASVGSGTKSTGLQEQEDEGGDDEGGEISDSEIESFILSAEEQKKKFAIWERINRPYLEEQQRRRVAKAAASTSGPLGASHLQMHQLPQHGAGGGEGGSRHRRGDKGAALLGSGMDESAAERPVAGVKNINYDTLD